MFDDGAPPGAGNGGGQGERGGGRCQSSARAVPATPVAAVPVAGPVAWAHAVVVAVQRLLSGADAALAPQWEDADRVAVLAALDRVGELVGVYRGRVLAAHRAGGRWASHGDRSFEAWRGRTTKQGVGAARSEVQLADGLAALPDVATAVETGETSLGHVRVLTRLRAGASERVRRALEDGGAAELLADARAAGWDAPTFARRAQAWAAARDVDGAQRSFDAVRERRFARVVDRDGGCAVEGFLDPVAGAAFRTALESLSPAPAPGDERTPDQRRADALVRMGERVLEIGDDRLGAQIRPHLSLLVPAQTWTAIQDRRARAGRQELHADGGDGRTQPGGGARADGGESALGREDGAVAVPLAELDDGTVVPPSELERLACDCEITRLVLDADGIPLDVGQTQRTFTKGLRRAILVRDGHCQWPGCTMRASWCEVHHVRWFSRGGRTSLENGLTLCSFHHHDVHRRGVTIETRADGTRFRGADGHDLGTTPRTGGSQRLSSRADVRATAARGPARHSTRGRSLRACAPVGDAITVTLPAGLWVPRGTGSSVPPARARLSVATWTGSSTRPAPAGPRDARHPIRPP